VDLTLNTSKVRHCDSKGHLQNMKQKYFLETNRCLTDILIVNTLLHTPCDYSARVM